MNYLIINKKLNLKYKRRLTEQIISMYILRREKKELP